MLSVLWGPLETIWFHMSYVGKLKTGYIALQKVIQEVKAPDTRLSGAQATTQRLQSCWARITAKFMANLHQLLTATMALVPSIADLTDSGTSWPGSYRWVAGERREQGQLGGCGASQVCPRPLPLGSRSHPALPPPWQGWRLTYCPWLGSDRRMRSRWRYTRLVKRPSDEGSVRKAGEVRSLAAWEPGQGLYNWVSQLEALPSWPRAQSRDSGTWGLSAQPCGSGTLKEQTIVSIPASLEWMPDGALSRSLSN